MVDQNNAQTSIPQGRGGRHAAFFAGAVGALLILWVVAATWVRVGFGYAFFVFVYLAVPFLIYLVILRPVLRRVGKSTAILCGSLIIVCAGYFMVAATEQTYVRDFVILLCTLLIALSVTPGTRNWMLARKYRHLPQLSRAGGLRLFVTFFLFSWVSITLVDRWFEEPPLKLNADRFRALKERSPWKMVRVGLALSGGGYRAASMHAGVLSALERSGVTVTHIASVSGGSIIGAFYAAGGVPSDFMAAVEENRFNLKRELIHIDNAVRLPFPGRIPGTNIELLPMFSFGRSEVQANLVDRGLFNGLRLAEFGKGDMPKLMLCATDLRTGDNLGFTASGVLRRPLITPAEKDNFINAPLPNDQNMSEFILPDNRNPQKDNPAKERVSRLVAASGAFPGAFNAIQDVIFGYTTKGNPALLPVLLADGGISDNSAISLLLEAQKNAPGWEMDLVISSDASALLERDTVSNPLIELPRAIDIIYANVGARRYSADGTRPALMLIGPGAFFETTLSPEDVMSSRWNTLNEVIFNKVPGIIERKVPWEDQEMLTFLAEGHVNKGRRSVAREYITQLFDSSSSEEIKTRTKEKLKEIFDEEFSYCLSTYGHVSTLKDTLSPVEARLLFRLGQYLVVLNWRDIHLQMEAAQERMSAKSNVSP